MCLRRHPAGVHYVWWFSCGSLSLGVRLDAATFQWGSPPARYQLCVANAVTALAAVLAAESTATPACYVVANAVTALAALVP